MSKTIDAESHKKEIGRATKTVWNMDYDVSDGTLGRSDAIQDSAIEQPVLTLTTLTKEMQTMGISASLDTLDLYFPDSPMDIPGLRVPSWRQEVAKGGGVFKARSQRNEGGRIDELEAWKTGDSPISDSNSFKNLTPYHLLGVDVDNPDICDFKNRSLGSPYTPLSSTSKDPWKGQSEDGIAQSEDPSPVSVEGLRGSNSLLRGLAASKRSRRTGGISKKQSYMSVRSHTRQSPIVSVRQGVSHMPVAPVFRTASSASSTGKMSPRVGEVPFPPAPTRATCGADCRLLGATFDACTVLKLFPFPSGPACGSNSSPRIGLPPSPAQGRHDVSPRKRGQSPIGALNVACWESEDFSRVLYGASSSFVGTPFSMNDDSPVGSPLDRRHRPPLSPLKTRPSTSSHMVGHDQQQRLSPVALDNVFQQGSRLQVLRFSSKEFTSHASPLRRRRLDSTDRPFDLISRDQVEQLAEPPEKPEWGQVSHARGRPLSASIEIEASHDASRRQCIHQQRCPPCLTLQSFPVFRTLTSSMSLGHAEIHEVVAKEESAAPDTSSQSEGE